MDLFNFIGAADRQTMTLLLRLAAFGSVLLTLVSIYPGVLVDLLLVSVLLSPLWLPALVIGGLVMMVVRVRSAKKAMAQGHWEGESDVGERPAFHKRPRVVLSTVLILCVVLTLVKIPTRVAFLLSWSAFQRHVATAPTTASYGSKPLNRLLGVYYVDRYAADGRGGVYFQTHSGPDGIGPDTMTYGFAYKPDPEGTPFGRARYRRSRIVGDWYVFSASNDY